MKGSTSVAVLVAMLVLPGCSGGNRTPSMGTGGELVVDGAGPGDGPTSALDAATGDGGTGPDGYLPDARPPDGYLPDAPGPDGLPSDADGTGDTSLADALPPLCPGTEQPWLSKVCFKFCQKIDAFDLGDLFAPPDQCMDLCKQVIAEHPDWLPNFLCVTVIQQHYQFSNCWWPKPLPDIPGCDDWCSQVLACDLEGAYYIPEDQCLCEATCSGIFALTGEAAEPLVACAAKALEGTCDPAAVDACYTMPLNCEQVCQGLSLQCDPGFDIKPLFPNTQACIDFCQQSSQDQLLGLQICLAVDKCHDPGACGDVPKDPLPGCAEFCDAFLALCPMAEVAPDTCPWVCTAAAVAMKATNALEAAACLEQYTVCPADPNYALVACLAPPCALLCKEAPKKCEPDSAWFEQFPSSDECMAACEGLSMFQAQAAGMCAIVGGCDHPEACMAPPATPAPGCDAYCSSLLDLCPSVAWLDASSCPAFCTGVGMQIPVVDPATAPLCLEQFDQCPQDPNDAVFGCLAGKCGTMCGLFEYCKPGSEYYTVYESKAACKEQCDTLTYSQAIETAFCLSWAGCDNAEDCTAPPPQPQEGCGDYCDALLAVCPGNGVVNPANCLDGCTGLSMAIPMADPGSATACLDGLDSCPPEPEKAVYGCLVDPPGECIDACAGLESCSLTEGWLCEVFCTMLEDSDEAGFDWFTTCVEDASTCSSMKACVGQ